MATFSKEITLTSGTADVPVITGYTPAQTDKIVVTPAGINETSYAAVNRNVNMWAQWDSSANKWVIYASSTSYAEKAHVIIVT